MCDENIVFRSARLAAKYYNACCHPANRVHHITFANWLRRELIPAIHSSEGDNNWQVSQADIDKAIEDRAIFPYRRS